ncbi:kelch-like protein 12 [Episyrphus balteatus]|uniref:kelch-like protein 12 n=1 Tax=Episyrphus balteatus TaxID=286459 RepID=UPI002485C53F|nr:kelch-like protein 12 [Episyrphus balteatus]
MTSTNLLSKNNTQTIFKCDKHAGLILEKLQTFYAENIFFDTVLIAGKETNDPVSLQAHRIVLSAMSEYFLEIFRDAQTALLKNILEFKEIEAPTLKSIIDFIYSGWIELSLENIERILRAASFLKMKLLVDGCLDFIEQNINSSNCLAWLSVARELSLSGLKAKSLECTYNHFEELSKDEEILFLSENELKDLLFNDNPYNDFEEEVFSALLSWINYDKTIREQLTTDLLSMVRFQHLSSKFIAENLSVCNNVESFQLVSKWLQWHLSPTNRSPLDQQQNHAFKSRSIAPKLGNIQISDSNEIVIQTYNQKHDSWSSKKPAILSRNKRHVSTIVIDNKLIVVGGAVKDDFATNSVECLDLRTFEWIDCSPMNYKRFMCQLADLNGSLCIFGGRNRGMLVDSIEMYNFSTHQMSELKSPTSPPTKTSQITSYNGILYVLDMCNGCLQSYDVSSQEWTFIKLEPLALRNFGFVALDGFLYVIGGRFKQNVKCYNLSDDTWDDVAPLSDVYCDINAIVYQDKIITCSKRMDDKVVVEEYNPETDTWKYFNSFQMDGSYYSAVMCSLKSNFN